MTQLTTSKPALGRLVQLDIRSYWAHEALEFTPWLAREENLALLGEAVDLELELQSTEQSVGPFAADIVCKRRSDGQLVLIENQIEKTDHSHLGQIITYAAGLRATTIIWIAKQFSEEHRAALDWLNEHTPSEVAFFAATVELWRIGDSTPAPRFSVVVRPNEWTKQTIQTEVMTDRRRFMLDYWSAFAEVVRSGDGSLRAPAPSKDSWVNFAIGKSGINLAAVINPTSQWIRMEVYLSGTTAKARFDQLATLRQQIDSTIPGLDWQRLDLKQDCRIALFKYNVDPRNRDDWPSQHEWLRDAARRFDVVFRPIVKQLAEGTPPMVAFENPQSVQV